MEGYGSLTAYAGQTITFSGEGSFYATGYECLFSGDGSLSGVSGVAAWANLSGVGELSTISTQVMSGNASLSPLYSFGCSVDGYAQGDAQLGALTSTGLSGFYDPDVGDEGYAAIQPLVSVGLLVATHIMQGDASLSGLVGQGGEGPYMIGNASLSPLYSIGVTEPDSSIIAIDRVFASSSFSIIGTYVISCMSNGSLISVNEKQRQAIFEFIDTLSAQSVLSFSGEFNVSALSSLIASSLNSANVGDLPDLADSNAVWCVNLETGAASQYEQYGFTGFLDMSGEYYGIANDGIYKLSGSTDAGNIINALIEFGKTNFNIPMEKRVNNVYLGISNSIGTIYLKVEADGVEYTYQMRSSSAELKNHRVDIGKGLSGNYWNFTIIDIGSDFDLADVQFEPVILSRKIK